MTSCELPAREEMISLRRSAMDSLARREHSRYQLFNKLCSKHPESSCETIDTVLDKLEADKLLSDKNFTEACIRYRKSKGYGPVFIRHHLNNCKVSNDIINEQLCFDDPDWEGILQTLLNKKLGGEIPKRGSKEFLKIQRFLLSRGFSMEQIMKL